MIRFYSVILFFLWLRICYSQYSNSVADSLIDNLSRNIKNPQAQIDSLFEYARTYLKLSPATTWAIAEKALELSEANKYLRGITLSHYYLGTSQTYEKYDIALEHLTKSYELADEMKDRELQAKTLIGISQAYHGMQQVDKSISYALEAKSIADQLDDQYLKSALYSNLANYYFNNSDLEEAIEYTKMALKIKQDLGDAYGIRLNCMNLGVMLLENDSTLKQGIEHLNKARSLAKIDPIMVNDIMANMILAYWKKDEIEKSILYLDSAILGSDTIENKYTKREIYRLGKDLYEYLGNYKQALKFAETEYDLDSELRGEEVESRFMILELESQNNEKEKQILLLEKKQTESNIKFIYSVGATLLSAIFVFILFRSNRFKKRSLDKLRNKQIEIEDKSHQLEIKNKEIEQFAYVASHDLKAPLNTIMSCINLLAEEIEAKLDDQAKQMAAFITSSADRMKSMIDTLLEHGRLGNGISFEVISLNDLINDVCQDLTNFIEESETELRINYLPEVKGSGTELRLLFQNLIANAIKFSRVKGKPIVSVTYKSLKSVKRHQISVKDNGIGIPKNRINKIFTLFERAHGKDYEGSGIGLAHCMKIVKLHKGSIWCESVEGKGTVFHFVLPMKDWNESEEIKEISFR